MTALDKLCAQNWFEQWHEHVEGYVRFADDRYEYESLIGWLFIWCETYEGVDVWRRREHSNCDMLIR